MDETQATAKSQSGKARRPSTPHGEHDARTQSEKFEAAARELGCDPNEDRFKDVLRKLAKPKS